MTAGISRSRKICHLTSVHVPFDTRIFHKEARSLAEAGYSVDLVAKHGVGETLHGVCLIPLPMPRSELERIFRIAPATFLRAYRQKADLYHFHDPELLPVGILLKLLTRGKVIYDVHEDYSEKIPRKTWLKSRTLKRIASAAYSFFERMAVTSLDHIIAVTDDIAAKYPAKKTTVIKNYVSLEMLDAVPPAKIDKTVPAAVYGGRLSLDRGAADMVNAVEMLGGEVELWLLGRWDAGVREYCETLPGWRYTRYLGAVTIEEATGIYKAADIGMHCVQNNDFYLRGIPTKMFEYAACGIPAVISRSPHWEKMFDRFALYSEPENPVSIADCLKQLTGDSDLRTAMGQRARQFVMEERSWEGEAQKLIALYDRLLDNRDTT